MMSQVRDELKPCPFCGKEAQVGHVGTYSTDSSYSVIECSACPAQMEIDKHRPSFEEIAAWNTRAALTSHARGEMEPVAWRWKHPADVEWRYSTNRPDWPAYSPVVVEPLYTTPPARAVAEEE